MEIQTYEIEEQVGGTTPEIEVEALALIEKMGLVGQQSLVMKKEGAVSERMQYPEMTKQEHAVYEAIFPEHTRLEQYSCGIIPVRVLQVAAHAKEFCDFLQVWHRRVSDPDPLLVGVIGKNEYSITKRFVLARWGDALRHFSELVKEARQIIRDNAKHTFEEQISAAQGNLARLDSLVEKKLAGEYVGI